ncbi:hypothetical protein [Halococcus saccharolyticus]|uniref:hypothetical protein n=1 Tax=Halococcus saccharolyticus TaxID=62319 RepID=UPI000B107B1A|nr:hypothetical protein [Halococcus saccharolyticus]
MRRNRDPTPTAGFVRLGVGTNGLTAPADDGTSEGRLGTVPRRRSATIVSVEAQ